MIDTDKQSTPSRLWKRIGIFMLILLAVFFSLSLIVHIPAVQNWGIRQITSHLSQKTGSAVSVRAFDFNVFSHMNLKDVFISQEATPEDTLLFAGGLGVRFSRLWKLFGRNPEIEQVRLNNARLYIDDRPMTFLPLFGKKKKGSSGIRLLNPEIIMDDVLVRVAKNSQKMTSEFILPHGVLNIDEINTDLRIVRLASIRMESPVVLLNVKPDSLIQQLDTTRILKMITGEVTGRDKWIYEIQDIHLADGKLNFFQPEAETISLRPGINYHDLQVSDLTVDLRNVCVDSARMVGEIRAISFAEHSGFSIEKIIAKSIELSADGIALGKLEVRTAGSVIMDTIALDFGRDIAEGTFAEKVSLYARFKNTQLSVADLLTAIPELHKSAFFTRNQHETLNLDGVVQGKLDRLRGDSLLMKMGDVTFAGQFRSRNLTTPGKQVLNLVVSDARFTPYDLEKHIPGFNLPEQFTRLGRIQFTGKFDGFLEDFVAYGKLNTDLGSAEVDINLETTNHVAAYNGALFLHEFNLQKWTDISDLGMISANLKLSNGSGLTPETAVADISGNITQFQYKGYTYKDAHIDGRLNQNQFDGKLEIHDPNIDLVFQGSVITKQGNPVFDFTADINQLDLKKLNLSKEAFSLEGVFVARGQGKDMNTLTGTLRATDLKVVRGDVVYALDTMFVDIEHQEDGRRLFRSTSDYIKGWVSGDFELNTLYPTLARFLEDSYPQYFSGLKYRRDLSFMGPEARFEVTLNDPEEWGGLVNLRDIRFRDLYIKGVLNFERDSVIIDLTTPEFHYGNVNAYQVSAQLESIGGYADAEAFVTVIDISEKYFFDEITASAQTSDNGFIWSLSADDLLEELNTLGVSGTFVADSNQTYTLHVDPQIIEVLEQKWELRDRNQIRFGKEFIELRDIVFQHEEQVVTIADIDRRGVMIETQHFDLHTIDDLWDYEKLNFGGAYTLRAGISDIFRREGFYLLIDALDVLVNDDSYGMLHVDCRMEEMGRPVSMDISLHRPGVHVRAEGAFFPPVPEMAEHLRNVIDVDMVIDTFPLAFLEYILKDGVRNTTGYAVGDVHIGGTRAATKMDGKAMIYNGATTVSYLGTRYTFHEQPVRLTESVIDASGAVLTDELGNTAVVEGGLTHHVLGRIGLDARIRSPRIMALNTQKEDNTAYYGRGIGTVDATFQGQVETPTISVYAITDQGTYIVINLADESAARKQSFIRFRDEEADGRMDYLHQTSITGMNFEMNLSATPQAVVEIMLEDNPPERIVGSGSGDIQLSITRSGDFTMYGQYEIEQGNYLFRSFVVTKPFELRRGGTIQWDGDPYNAVINLQADYVGLRASLYTLLAEYLTPGSEAEQEAKRKTDVHLRLLLTGTLLEPEINFDFSFPNLSGELAGYADTKLRVLKSNQNALNEQVFGLLWAGSFLPSNVLQSDASLQLAEQGISNTMSEFLSNYVSGVFSSAISKWIGSEIDFDVGYSEGSQFDIPEAPGSSSTYREWELRVKNRLFNNRVIIDAGANYSADDPIGTGDYFVGDYALEYLLTEDGRLKIRFYQRNEPTIEGRKNKLGIGLAWRREFDSFDEWFGGLRKEAKKLKEKNQDEEGEGGG